MRVLLAVVIAACAGSYGTSENGVVFTHDSPLSRNAEIARRALPPLAHRLVEQTLAARNERLAEQAIDLSKEKFDIYVPAGPPPRAGYGLIVFIAPWAEPTQPHYWGGPLDQHKMIFVSPRNAGNGMNLLDRRLPLALLAYENVHALYPIDDKRVYVTGLSGGSRVAEIAALAYPDIFRGVILNAGADPIDGRAGMYKPPADLFRAFQHSRIVVITGDEDTDVERDDDVAIDSLRDACVLDIKTESFHGGHQSLDSLALARALDDLEAPRHVDDAALARCNARVAHELDGKLAEVAAAIARDDRKTAHDLLIAIDAKYGGLAAPRTLELDARLR